MNQNRIGKYLLYALGEIILIIIGILFALEINNWNENRKTKVAERLLLEGLLVELKSNKNSLVTAMVYHEKSSSSARELLKIYNSGQIPTNKSNVDSLLALTQWAWTFDPEVGMINAIKASGYLNAVRNTELRNLIASFEDLSRDTREEDLIVQNMIINNYVPLVSKYVSMVQRTKYLGDIYVAIDSTRTPPNYEELFNDREFESLLAYLYTWRADGKMEGENFLKLIVKFINNIEEELENRE